MDHCEEISAEFFVSRRQSPHVLHGAKEPFDNVAHPVKTGIVGDGFSRVGFRWDNGERALVGDG